MGLLDAIAGQVLGSLNGANTSQQSPLLEIIAQLLAGNQQGGGGLGGLMRSFEAGGLGDIMASWVGTGQNQPISPDQLSSVLGGGSLAGFAQQLGLSEQDLTSQLAQVLPGVVDKMTPDGQLPQSEAGISDILGMFK